MIEFFGGCMITDPGVDNVKESMISLFPNNEYRKIYLNLFLKALKKADSFGSNKWGVYYYDKGVRLLVGNLIVFTVHRDGVWLALDKQSIREMNHKCILLDKSELWKWETGDYAEYKPVPSMNGYYFPSNEDLDIWPILREFHFNYIEKVAAKYKWLSIRSQPKNSYENSYKLQLTFILCSIDLCV